MVDEYQDTNKVQYELIRRLVSEHRNLAWWATTIVHPRLARGRLQHHPRLRQALSRRPRGHPRPELPIHGDHPERRERRHKNNQVRREKSSGPIRRRAKARLDRVRGRGQEAEEALKWMKFIQDRTGARYSDFAFLYRSNQQSARSK